MEWCTQVTALHSPVVVNLAYNWTRDELLPSLLLFVLMGTLILARSRVWNNSETSEWVELFFPTKLASDTTERHRQREPLPPGAWSVKGNGATGMCSAAVPWILPGLSVGGQASILVYLVGAGVVLALGRWLWRKWWRYRASVRQDVHQLRLLAHSLGACCDGVLVAEGGRSPNSPLRIVYSNPAFDRLLGFAESEAVGLSPSVLADQAEPDALEAVRLALRGTQIVRLEVPSRRKDGSRVWTEWQIVPVADQYGRFTHTVAIIRDTTQRRCMEQQLRESEARFRSLFEHAADAIVLFDSSGQVVDANPCACQSFGYGREEFRQYRFQQLEVHSEAVDSVTGGTQTRECLYRRKDGSVFPAEVRYAWIEASGQRLRMALIRDVSRRRQTELALRERENLLRNILAAIPCGVFWKDRELRYVGCNEQVARDMGFGQPEQLIGKTDYEIVPLRTEAEFFRSCDQRVLETGQPLMYIEEPLTTRDGICRTLLTSKVPLRDPQGTIIGVVGVYQDISERKRLEQQLFQAQKMEAVGRLAGGIAHDFNNLLTIIRGNADLLRAQLNDAPNALLERLDDLRLAADRAAALVRQLLMFSRQSSGQVELVDLNNVIRGMASMLDRLLGERIRLVTDLSAEPATLLADYSHLEQVIMNLAVNAGDAMPQGGTLTLATRLLPATTLDPVRHSPNHLPQRWIELRVIDTGIGMTDAVKNRIFEPFFTTKGPDKGTGLGLATVFGIVQRLGGQIRVESAPHRGTTFTLLLPWTAGQPAPSTRTPLPPLLASQLNRQNGRLLLVEDEDALRKLARIALESQGYQVYEAPDAETALQLLETHADLTFDILVTDLIMPGIDGRELAQRLLQRYPHLAIVFMSGYVPDSIPLDAFATAVFLAKPFTPSDLCRGVATAAQRQGARVSSVDTVTNAAAATIISPPTS